MIASFRHRGLEALYDGRTCGSMLAHRGCWRPWRRGPSPWPRQAYRRSVVSLNTEAPCRDSRQGAGRRRKAPQGGSSTSSATAKPNRSAGSFYGQARGGMGMFNAPFWGAFRCLRASSGPMEAPPTPRPATPRRSLALDHDNKMGLNRSATGLTFPCHLSDSPAPPPRLSPPRRSGTRSLFLNLSDVLVTLSGVLS